MTVADAGYHSGPNLAECNAGGHKVLMPETHDRRRRNPYHKDHFTYRPQTDTYLCPQQKVLTYKDSFTHSNGYRVRRYRANSQDCGSCPAFGKCTSSKNGRSIRISEHEPILQRHRQLMATVPAKKLYRRRIAIVEPVFGLLKEWHGARRFLLRGRSHVVSEWHLLANRVQPQEPPRGVEVWGQPSVAPWGRSVAPTDALPDRRNPPSPGPSLSLSPFCSYHPPSDCVPHPTHHAPHKTMRQPPRERG